MKKFLSVIMLLFIVVGLTACGKNKMHKKGSLEYLLDSYVAAYNDKDINKLKDVMPDFMKTKLEYTDSEWKKGIEDFYGDDLKVTYEIASKTKIDQDDLDAINAVIKEYYKSDKTASECYELEGTISYVSSKLSHSYNLNDIHYCKIDNEWYLLFD